MRRFCAALAVCSAHRRFSQFPGLQIGFIMDAPALVTVLVEAPAGGRASAVA